MLFENITRLVEYGIHNDLLEKEDRIYCINAYLELFNVSEYEERAVQGAKQLEQILEELVQYAIDMGLIKDGSMERDLFDTKIMSIIVPRPSSVIGKFNQLRTKDPSLATDYFYKFSQDTDYIRRYRIAKDVKWQTRTIYGKLDISINLSKPEKDPKAIAAAKNAKQGGYPKCLLCVENEGYAGRSNHPARQNHRIMPVLIQGCEWGFQYSPYVYYNEHCIIFNKKHIPMKIEKATFEKLLDFVYQFPHYFVGSNADLPIVGGSILSHDHFQGGNYEFPMAKALEEEFFKIKGYEDIEVAIVEWPMSVLRIKCEDPKRLILLADYILEKWRGYTDEDAFIYARTNQEPHNTITPIARKRGGKYEVDLVLRNNITTAKHPMGVYHPHEKLHHIKKENIGLIEVMGLAILPSRLQEEMDLVKNALLNGLSLNENEKISKHAVWVSQWKDKYKEINKRNIDQILKDEIGQVFCEVLEDAGVYKCSPEGRKAFRRFIYTV